LLQVSGKALSDSDSLAAQVAVDVAADVFVVLSDVDGVFSRPPGSDGAQKIDLFHPSTHFTTGFTVVLVLLYVIIALLLHSHRRPRKRKWEWRHGHEGPLKPSPSLLHIIFKIVLIVLIF
jgi:hypothetical protein